MVSFTPRNAYAKPDACIGRTFRASQLVKSKWFKGPATWHDVSANGARARGVQQPVIISTMRWGERTRLKHFTCTVCPYSQALGHSRHDAMFLRESSAHDEPHILACRFIQGARARNLGTHFRTTHRNAVNWRSGDGSPRRNHGRGEAQAQRLCDDATASRPARARRISFWRRLEAHQRTGNPAEHISFGAVRGASFIRPKFKVPCQT